MAEDRKDESPRAERRRKLYDHDGSKKARGEPAKDEGASPDRSGGHASPKSADDKHLSADGVLGRHAEEREALRKAHEAERRDEHGRQRDEHRAMNARHETEHEGAKTLHENVALNRKHEHEKHALRGEHEKRQKDMAERHHAERHTMNTKHEAELAGGEAAAAPTPEAAGSEGPETV